MPRAPEPPWPVRGVPGGWRDWWDGPDDHAQLRAQAAAAEAAEDERAAQLGRRLRRAAWCPVVVMPRQPAPKPSREQYPA